MFAQDVVSYADSGGAVPGASHVPVRGALRLAEVVSAAADWLWAGVEVETATVNGGPAVLLRRDRVIFAVLSLSASTDGIDQVMWTMNPRKLGGVGRPAST